MTLRWHQFGSLTEARSEFRATPCVYVQTDSAGRAIRVGKTSAGLWRRYYGGTAYAIDAAMHGSGNRVYVARAKPELVADIEATLIWQCGGSLLYNNVGKRKPPPVPLKVKHAGQVPQFG